MTTHRPRPTTTARRLWWRAVLTPVAALAALALATAGILLTAPGGTVFFPAFQNWQDRRWQPGAWSLTADDFPAGTATTVEVQEAWLTDRREYDPDRYPAAARLPGLRHLSDYEPRSGLTTSGVRVGDLDVFTSIRTYDVVTAEEVPVVLGSRLKSREYRVYEDTGERPAPLGVTVNEPLHTDPALEDAVHLGDRTVTLRSESGSSFKVDDGPHGYFGVAGTTTDVVTGQPRQVAAVLAPRDEHLITIGLSAPTTAVVDWEAELDRIVAMVEAKTAADPDGNGLTWR
jgi:hypothetical protein